LSGALPGILLPYFANLPRRPHPAVGVYILRVTMRLFYTKTVFSTDVAPLFSTGRFKKSTGVLHQTVDYFKSPAAYTSAQEMIRWKI